MIGQTIPSWAGVESKGDHTIHLPGQSALGYLSVPPLVYSLFFSQWIPSRIFMDFFFFFPSLIFC